MNSICLSLSHCNVLKPIEPLLGQSKIVNGEFVELLNRQEADFFGHMSLKQTPRMLCVPCELFRLIKDLKGEAFMVNQYATCHMPLKYEGICVCKDAEIAHRI